MTPLLQRTISILIIENDNMSRVGAIAILSENERFKVCSAKYGKEGLEIIKSQKLDIVVINIDLPDMCGMEAIKTIKSIDESTKIVVMTANTSHSSITTAIHNGADSYYNKNRNSHHEEIKEKFVDAILSAYNDEPWIDPSISKALINRFRSKDEEDKQLNVLNEFSTREMRALKLTAEGRKNCEIAKLMHVSEGTVRSYLCNSFSKLGVRDRLNAVRESIRLGILEFTDMNIEQEAVCSTESGENSHSGHNEQNWKQQQKSYRNHQDLIF